MPQGPGGQRIPLLLELSLTYAALHSLLRACGGSCLLGRRGGCWGCRGYWGCWDWDCWDVTRPYWPLLDRYWTIAGHGPPVRRRRNIDHNRPQPPTTVHSTKLDRGGLRDGGGLQDELAVHRVGTKAMRCFIFPKNNPCSEQMTKVCSAAHPSSSPRRTQQSIGYA